MSTTVPDPGRVCRVCGGPGLLAWADGYYCGSEPCWDARTWGRAFTPPRPGEAGTCQRRCHDDARACYDCRCPGFRPWMAPNDPAPEAAQHLSARVLKPADLPPDEDTVRWWDRDTNDPDAPGVTVAAAARRTSVTAALTALPRSGTQRRRVLDAIVDAHARGHHGATDPELQRHLALPANSQRPRRLELVGAGWVADSGRVRSHGGRDHVVWAPTPATLRTHAQPTTEEKP